MSSSSAENITFMVIRGVVALAIIGVAFYCLGQGLHFFTLPHNEAEAIQVHVLGLNISASGLGAVIFGTGIALCFVGYRAAPKKFEARRKTEDPPSPPSAPPPDEPRPQAAKPSAVASDSTVPRSVPVWTPSRIIEESTVVTKVISPSDNPFSSDRNYM